VQNFAQVKDNNEHLSFMVSSLRMQLDESNAEKRQLQYENKSLRARLNDIEHSDRALHKSSMQEKDNTAARESTHCRHGMDGASSESAQPRDHILGFDISDRAARERNMAALEVCLAYVHCGNGQGIGG